MDNGLPSIFLIYSFRKASLHRLEGFKTAQSELHKPSL